MIKMLETRLDVASSHAPPGPLRSALDVAEMMRELGKGSKVQMVGGELGTVVEVRDDEVVVKVDENTNTRIRYTRSAVSAVLDND